MNTIANSSLVKHINYDLIWNYLLEKTSATIPNISENIGLSLPTVTRAIEYGLSLDMVVPSEIANSTGGRKAQIYKLNSEYEYYLLIVLDNEKLHYQIKNFTGEILCDDIVSTKYTDVIDNIDNLIACSLSKFSKIKKVAVAFTGVIDKGVLIDCWRNSSLNNFKFEEYFEQKYNVTVIFENNIRSVSIATKRHIKDYDKKTIVMFEYGHTGYGSGIIINGDVLRGANGSAGEIGSNPVNTSTTSRTIFYSKQLISLISILNPHSVVIYTNDDNINFNEFMEHLKESIAPYRIPEFKFADDFLNDCFYGLTELCIIKSKEELKK